MKSAADLPVGVVLTESVHGPDGGGNPTKKSDLEKKADDPGERSADGEEGKPGEQKSDDESHAGTFSAEVCAFKQMLDRTLRSDNCQGEFGL